MDGRNCNGRKISLLNGIKEAGTVQSPRIRLPPLLSYSHESGSSCASTPALTPQQTPQLVRSHSTDSQSFPTPSPLTPSYNNFESAVQNAIQKQNPQQHYVRQHSYSKMDDPTLSFYPPIPDATGLIPSAYPLPPHIPQQMSQLPVQQAQRPSSSPASEPSHVSTLSATSNPKSQPKKNQYPCPMAKQVGCTDFFTTSGHAARHAKKHTGKKDAYCPECNKAFTRKDNMEQHRRTHQTGRGSRSVTGNNNNSDDAKVKKPVKQPSKKSTVKAEPQLEAAALEQLMAEQQQQQPVQPILQQPFQPQVAQQIAQQIALEQALMMPTNTPYFLGNSIDTGPIPALPLAVADMGMRPPLHRSSIATSLDYIPPIAPMLTDPDMNYSYPSPGLSNGLESLALAACEHRRLSEEKAQSRSPQESPLQESPSSEVSS